jgi:hypothetical protein
MKLKACNVISCGITDLPLVRNIIKQIISLLPPGDCVTPPGECNIYYISLASAF